MRIELRLEDSSDSDPHAEYRWLWQATGRSATVDPPDPGSFIEPGIRRYVFELGTGDSAGLSLKSIRGPLRTGPPEVARITIKVDLENGLPEDHLP